MQIHIAAANHVNMHVGNDINNSLSAQQHKNTLQTNTSNVFGPQCKVTISREGRKRSEQSKAEGAGSYTAGSTERLLLRQQKQSEQGKDEQSGTLKEISGLMAEIKNSYKAGEDKETITNKQDALNRLLELKARQEEENEQRIKDAVGSAAGASKEQEEIDQKNADLYLMLKTLEEKEEQGGEGPGAESDTAGTDEAQDSVSSQFRQSADQLGVSAAKRELQVTGMIEGMFQGGYGKLAEADAMMHEVQAELDLAAEFSVMENLSEAERDQLTAEHIGRANAMLESNYEAITDLRRKGYQEIRDAQEVSLRHIADSPLDGVNAAKQTIMEAGVAAAFHEVSQDALDKTSAELEERVQEAIDERNDTATAPEEDEGQAKAELEKAVEEDARTPEERELEEELLEKNPILNELII